MPSTTSRPEPRCRAAILYGTTLATRCMLPALPTHEEHVGKGLAEFPYQRIRFFDGDRRLILDSDREDEFSWAVVR